jgi:23S rRNA (cytidine1920-2'-O)/16S rRNA (cytidine1409-2'-O)-methyltransferase
MEERIDKIIIERKLVADRPTAEKMIKESGVLVNGKLILKPGKKFATDVEIELVVKEEAPFVSKDALKLIQAIEKWDLKVEDHKCLDVGAGAGGFTDVLLRKGAKRVYALDAAKSKLTESLRTDDRVYNLNDVNIRDVEAIEIAEKLDTIVVDVSHISLRLVFPTLMRFAKKGTQVVTVIKPQFELGKANVGRNGTIKDNKLYTKAINDTKDTAFKLGFQPQGICDSPLKEKNGNKEFLLYSIYEGHEL